MLYAMLPESIQALDHSSEGVKEPEPLSTEPGRCCFNSSRNGESVSFGHKVDGSADANYKWLIRGSKSGEYSIVKFDTKRLISGSLSRDGQILRACNLMASVTRVYKAMKELGEDPTTSIKYAIEGRVLAISGNGNRVIVGTEDWLEIHDICTRRLVWRADGTAFRNNCALDGDGSEAAFARCDDKLRVVKVKSVSGIDVDPSAVVKVLDSKPFVNSLYVLYNHIASLFDPSTKKLIPLKFLKRRKEAWSAISPSGDYIAVVRREGCGTLQTNVWRKLKELTGRSFSNANQPQGSSSSYAT